MNPSASRRLEILLVDDNEDDVFLMREAFKRTQMPANFHYVENGVECLAWLRRQGPHGDAPRPDLILLDLNMPLMDGREVLATLVGDPELRDLPVVVLTTSSNQQDVEQMYRLRCSTYIVKPLDLEEFERAIRLIGEYWFSLARLPQTRN